MKRTKAEMIAHGKLQEKIFGINVSQVLIARNLPYQIHHMKNDTCCVDFVIKSLEPQTTLCFLELKSRTGISTYPSYRIGVHKMKEIRRTGRQPAYLVWIDETSGQLFYTKYREEFIHYKQHKCPQYKTWYILVDKTDTIEATLEEMIVAITS